MMLKNVVKTLKFRSRKGMDKPIFAIAALTLALMFLALYFAAVSGWVDGLVEQFNNAVSEVG